MNRQSNFTSKLAALLPRHGAALLAIVCVAGTVGYGISREIPVGSVRGRVVLGLERRPFAGVKVTLTSNDQSEAGSSDEALGSEVRRVRAVTDANGEFEIPRVPAGFYRLSAAAKWHRVDEKTVWVTEKETSEVAVHLQRSEPDLIAAQQQRNYLASERLLFPIRGYVDGGAATPVVKAATRSSSPTFQTVAAPPKQSPGQDTVRVRVFQTTLAAVMSDARAAASLSSVGDRYSEQPSLPPALLHPASGPAPRLISERTMSITQADNEGFFHQRLDLGAPGPGLYLMDATHIDAARGKLTVASWALVSDIALVVKKARGELLAYTVHTKTGQPQPGAVIRVLRDMKPMASARSNSDGLARIQWETTTEAGGDGGRLITLARLGAHEATVGAYDYEGEDNGDFTICAYTDRPIYRPGGRVQYKGIVRRALERGIRYRVPVGQPVDFEVRDPQGERILRRRYTTNHFGSFAGDVELSPEAPTGTYTMAMTLAGQEHTESFAVASYKKPEFTATVTANRQHYTRGEEIEMFVAAQFYFGAPVSGAKVSYSILRAPDWDSYYEMEYGGEDEEYDNSDYEYFEGEGDYSGSGETVQEGETKLDENGHAIIRFTDTEEKRNENGKTAEYSGAPQEQVYTLLATVTDASGREIQAQGKARIAAGDFRLSARPEGYVAEPGKAARITLTTRDFSSRPVPGVKVELQTGYEKWNEVSNKSEYTPGPRYEAMTGADGTARIEVTPKQRGEMRLEAVAHDKEGHVIQTRSGLWVADDSGGDFGAQYSDLSLLTDKKRYEAGEVARVLINAEHAGGTALLSIEGSKIFRAWLVPVTRRSSVLHVPITNDYGPNVVLSACTVHNKKFAQSSVPLRVDVPDRQVKVMLRADAAKYRPGDKITYQVQTTDAKGAPLPAEFSFGVVDEAIYALREDNPRLLQTTFYPRRYNSVQTAYSFEPMYLGDADKAEPVIESREKFLDTAFWQPSLQTDATGRATVTVDLPDNLTTWRATAIAQTEDSAFGRQSQKSTVAKDFFVRLETPRFLTGGDASQIVAFVHNATATSQTATVKLEASGVKFTENAIQQMTLAPRSVVSVMWSVSTETSGLDFANTARLKVTAWTDKSASGQQFTDGLEITLPVRPHGREQIERFAGQITSGEPVTHQIATDSAALPASSRLTIRIAPSLTDALVGALDYLIGFPYGCTEQTMSRFLPDIMVQRMLRLSGDARAGDDERAQRMRRQLPRMVRDGLTRLYRFQNDSGGWGWWEADKGDAWMTAYVMYGLMQARNEGYNVSPDVLARGKSALTKMLKSDISELPMWQQEDNWNTRAFVLYVLALCGDTKSTHAARLQMKTDTLEAQSLAWLVLLDQQLGLKNTSAWPELEQQIVDSNDGTLYWKGTAQYEWSNWNDRTATALGLQALLAVDRSDERIDQVLLWLMMNRTGDYWGSTRDTSWVMAALCDYVTGKSTLNAARSTPGASPGKGAINVRLNGRLLQSYPLGSAAGGNEIVLRVPWQSLKSGGNSVSIECSGAKTPAFYSVESRQTIAAEELPALSPPRTPMTVAREFRRIVAKPSGNNDWTLQTEPIGTPEMARMKQGDRIRVRLTFDTSRDLSYVLIEDTFPAGCEVTERGSADVGSDDWDHWWSSTDVRDDRVAFFATRLPKGKHVIEYNLRAQTPGSYRALPTMLQAMYAPDVRAESAETRVEVQ